MKSHFNWTLIIIQLTLSSCTREIELNDIINQDLPFILTQQIQKVDSNQVKFRVDTLKINSKKWSEFIKFMTNNKDKWESTPASFISDFYITQNDFRLLGWKDGGAVVISYKDKNGKIRQLTKKIKIGEINFLTN